MRRSSGLLLAVALLSCPVTGAEPAGDHKKLTNQQVVSMLKAGVAPEIVVQTISIGSNEFDISADALIALKQQRVPDEVIRAMVCPGSNTSPPVSSPVSEPQALRSAHSLRSVTL